MSSLLAVGTAPSVWAILLTVQVPVIALSTFRFSVSKNVQVSTNYCSPLSGKKMSRIKCAGGCTTFPGCQGFRFTCDSVTKQCQCLLCSAFNISTPTSVGGVFVGVFKSTGNFLQVTDCGPPPEISRTVHTNEGTLSGYNVTYQCSSPYLYIKGTTIAFCQYNGMWTVPTIKCGVCGAPLLVNRTFVVHSNTADQYDVALYNCSVRTDVYVKGTNNVTCNKTSAWPVPTILCALKARIDNKPPSRVNSLRLKLKKLMLEGERLSVIERDNKIMLEHIIRLMRGKSCIDHINKYTQKKSLTMIGRVKEINRINRENKEILNFILNQKTQYDHIKFEMDYQDLISSILPRADVVSRWREDTELRKNEILYPKKKYRPDGPQGRQTEADRFHQACFPDYNMCDSFKPIRVPLSSRRPPGSPELHCHDRCMMGPLERLPPIVPRQPPRRRQTSPEESMKLLFNNRVARLRAQSIKGQAAEKIKPSSAPPRAYSKTPGQQLSPPTSSNRSKSIPAEKDTVKPNRNQSASPVSSPSKDGPPNSNFNRSPIPSPPLQSLRASPRVVAPKSLSKPCYVKPLDGQDDDDEETLHVLIPVTKNKLDDLSFLRFIEAEHLDKENDSKSLMSDTPDTVYQTLEDPRSSTERRHSKQASLQSGSSKEKQVESDYDEEYHPQQSSKDGASEYEPEFSSSDSFPNASSKIPLSVECTDFSESEHSTELADYKLAKVASLAQYDDASVSDVRSPIRDDSKLSQDSSLQDSRASSVACEEASLKDIDEDIPEVMKHIDTSLEEAYETHTLAESIERQAVDVAKEASDTRVATNPEPKSERVTFREEPTEAPSMDSIELEEGDDTRRDESNNQQDDDSSSVYSLCEQTSSLSRMDETHRLQSSPELPEENDTTDDAEELPPSTPD